jgi:hypothetical protein
MLTEGLVLEAPVLQPGPGRCATHWREPQLLSRTRFECNLGFTADDARLTEAARIVSLSHKLECRVFYYLSCRDYGAPSWPRAACSVPYKAGQSWWPLLTGDGGDLSRPVPGVRLVPSRPAVSFGEGGTMVPRKMVPPRVWIPIRASCSPSPASRVKSRPDAMAGFSAWSCVTSYEANSKFPPGGRIAGQI